MSKSFCTNCGVEVGSSRKLTTPITQGYLKHPPKNCPECGTSTKGNTFKSDSAPRRRADGSYGAPPGDFHESTDDKVARATPKNWETDPPPVRRRRDGSTDNSGY